MPSVRRLWGNWNGAREILRRQEDIELLKAGMFWVPIAVALLGIFGTLAGAVVGGLLSR